MKKFTLLIASALLMSVGALHGQEAGDSLYNDSQAFSGFLNNSEIVGSPVLNHENEKIGSIERVLVDSQTGDIRFAVVSTGGFLGMGDTQSVIPWKIIEVKHEADKGDAEKMNPKFYVDATKEKLKEAPNFDAKAEADLYDEGQSESVFEYWGATWVAPADRMKMDEAGETQLNVNERDAAIGAGLGIGAPGAKTESSIDTDLKTDLETDLDSNLDTDLDTATETTIDTDLNTATETTIDTDLDTETDTTIDTDLDTKTESELDLKTEPTTTKPVGDLEEATDETADQLEETTDEATDAVDETTDEFNDTTEETAEEAADTLEETSDELNDASEETAEELNDASSEIDDELDDTSESLDETADSLEDAQEEVDPAEFE